MAFVETAGQHDSISFSSPNDHHAYMNAFRYNDDESLWKETAEYLRQKRDAISAVFARAWEAAIKEQPKHELPGKTCKWFAENVMQSLDVLDLDKEWVRPMLIAWARFWCDQGDSIRDQTWRQPKQFTSFVPDVQNFTDMIAAAVTRGDSTDVKRNALHDFVRCLSARQTISDAQKNRLLSEKSAIPLAQEGRMILGSTPEEFPTWESYMTERFIPLLSSRYTHTKTNLRWTGPRLAFDDVNEFLSAAYIVRGIGYNISLDQQMEKYMPMLAHMLSCLDYRTVNRSFT